MAYRLIVTRPNGTQYQTSTEPLPDRDSVGMSALRALTGEGVAFGRDGMVFGRQVRDAAIGQRVEYASTGYTFRTEDF